MTAEQAVRFAIVGSKQNFIEITNRDNPTFPEQIEGSLKVCVMSLKNWKWDYTYFIDFYVKGTLQMFHDVGSFGNLDFKKRSLRIT